jgi:hypothetical protein
VLTYWFARSHVPRCTNAHVLNAEKTITWCPPRAKTRTPALKHQFKGLNCLTGKPCGNVTGEHGNQSVASARMILGRKFPSWPSYRARGRRSPATPSGRPRPASLAKNRIVAEKPPPPDVAVLSDCPVTPTWVFSPSELGLIARATIGRYCQRETSPDRRRRVDANPRVGCYCRRLIGLLLSTRDESRPAPTCCQTRSPKWSG